MLQTKVLYCVEKGKQNISVSNVDVRLKNETVTSTLHFREPLTFELTSLVYKRNKLCTLGFMVGLHDKKLAANSLISRVTVLLMSGLSSRFLYADRKDLLHCV